MLLTMLQLCNEFENILAFPKVSINLVFSKICKHILSRFFLIFKNNFSKNKLSMI